MGIFLFLIVYLCILNRYFPFFPFIKDKLLDLKTLMLFWCSSKNSPLYVTAAPVSLCRAECVELGQVSQSGIPEAQSILMSIRNSYAFILMLKITKPKCKHDLLFMYLDVIYFHDNSLLFLSIFCSPIVIRKRLWVLSFSKVQLNLYCLFLKLSFYKPRVRYYTFAKSIFAPFATLNKVWGVELP